MKKRFIYLLLSMFVFSGVRAQVTNYQFSLISPSNAETIYTTLPNFLWSDTYVPPISTPENPSTDVFKFRLVKLEANQTKDDAMGKNVSVFEQVLSDMQTLAYSPANQALTVGSTYAWQLTLTRKGQLLSSSEVYQFTIGVQSTTTSIPLMFNEMLPKLDAGFAVITQNSKAVLFKFADYYEMGTTNAVLTRTNGTVVTNTTLNVINAYPTDALSKYFMIDLSQTTLTNGEFLYLKVTNSKNVSRVLRIRYVDTNASGPNGNPGGN